MYVILLNFKATKNLYLGNEMMNFCSKKFSY